MATNFPSSLDNGTNLPNPTSANTQNSPDHASLHSNAQDGLKAVEAKLGIGASTPVANTLMFGTGVGTSAWTALTSAQLAATLSDETGTGSAVFATSPTFVTPKVDTINEATIGNGTTVGGVNIKTGVIQTASAVGTTALASSAVTSDKVSTGMVVQMVASTSSAVATGTTILPYDDTIPQITEGFEVMTQAITPKSATNRLFIEAKLYASASVTELIAGALFQDSTANALAAYSIYAPTATGEAPVYLTHDMVAGTTSSTTFRARLGPEIASTITFNGRTTRKYGGVTLSTFRITEYKA